MKGSPGPSFLEMRKSVFVSAAMVLSFISAVSFAAPSQRLQDLRKERRELEREIRKAVPDINKRDPKLDKLQRESIEATKDYEKAIDSHPNLQKFKAEMTAATAKLTRAIGQKDEKAKESAGQEVSAVMSRRMEAAGKEPDLKPLAKANEEAGDAYFKRRKEVLAKLPETSEAAAKLEKVNAEIQEELRKQR